MPAGVSHLEHILSRLPAEGAAAEIVDDWLDELLEWLLVPRGPIFGRYADTERTARLQALAERLRGDGPEGPLARFLRDVWHRTSAVRFLAEFGLPARASFTGEAWSRLVDRVFPRFDARFDLATLLFRLDLQEADLEWLAAQPGEVLGAFGPVLALEPDEIAAAARLVAHRAAAFGLARPLLRLGGPEVESPFLDLPAVAQTAAAGPADEGALAAWQRIRGRCVGELRRMRSALDQQGVSTEVLFLLELVEAQLGRIDALLAVLGGRAGAFEMALALARAGLDRRSLRALLRSKLKRLSLEVVEHTGETGEHYVAYTWAELRRTAASAAIGGVVTAFTAAAKYAVAGLGLASGLSGLAQAVNYSSSFILIHFLHGSLASKQPAMTAAALAKSLEGESSSVSRVLLVAGIARAQAAATAGNLLAAVPIALALDAAWVAFAGRPVLDGAAAHHAIEALHPLHTATLPYAALTGVLLWLSSLAAGWAANWSDFRALPEAIRHSLRCRRVLGGGGARALSDLVRGHVSGVTGYLALGLLLGFLPTVIAFMGAPAEVRHVTLSGASLALGAAGQLRAGHLDVAAAAWAALGVGLIGLLNFGVSFALALAVALRARGLARGDRRLLWRQLALMFVRRPLWFVFPPSATTAPARAPAVP